MNKTLQTRRLWRGSTSRSLTGSANRPDVAAGVTRTDRFEQRVVRTRYVRVATLKPAHRAVLLDELYEIYQGRVTGFSREQFDAQVMGSGDSTLALYYGPKDELAGFSYANVERLTHEQREHAVFAAGVYFRANYRGGIRSTFFGFRQTLLFKLREPRTPLAYCTRCSSPAPYRLLVSVFPRAYPSRRSETPPHVEGLARTLVMRWRLVATRGGPWVVSSVATPKNPQRLRRLETDPDVKYYLALNPDFASGESVLLWMPLDLRNALGGFVRALRMRMSR